MAGSKGKVGRTVLGKRKSMADHAAAFFGNKGATGRKVTSSSGYSKGSSGKSKMGH